MYATLGPELVEPKLADTPTTMQVSTFATLSHLPGQAQTRSANQRLKLLGQYTAATVFLFAVDHLRNPRCWTPVAAAAAILMALLTVARHFAADHSRAWASVVTAMRRRTAIESNWQLR